MVDGCFPDVEEREERAGWADMFHYGGNGLLSTYPAAMENTEWLVGVCRLMGGQDENTDPTSMIL